MEKWTQFWDMHSGGGTKLYPYEKIYIEATKDEAIEIFENKFGRDPHNVTCTCCGEDYVVEEYDSLEKATAFERNCRWKDGNYVEEGEKYIPLSVYKDNEDVLIISKENLE